MISLDFDQEPTVNASPQNRIVAKHVAAAFGGSPKVHAYHHDIKDMSVAILMAIDRPCVGVTSYSTVGNSDFSMLKDGVEFPARVELAGACATDSTDFPNILASLSFKTRVTQEFLYPGRIIRDCVGEYYRNSTTPHALLTNPFLWDDLSSISVGSYKVAWLQMVPISEREMNFMIANGYSALEDLFEEFQIDVYDINRPSVV